MPKKKSALNLGIERPLTNVDEVCIPSLSKGQLISKCLIGSIVSTKKPTKFF